MKTEANKQKPPTPVGSGDLLGAAIRKSVKQQIEESANAIAREVAEWIAENGVLDVYLDPDGIEVWVNGDPVKHIKWGNLLENGIKESIKCGCHKEMPKDFAALSAKLKCAAKLIDDAIAPNEKS